MAIVRDKFKIDGAFERSDNILSNSSDKILLVEVTFPWETIEIQKVLSNVMSVTLEFTVKVYSPNETYVLTAGKLSSVSPIDVLISKAPSCNPYQDSDQIH